MRDIKLVVPEGIDVNIINGNMVIVKGPKGELKRTFKDVNIILKDNIIEVESRFPPMINTVKRHIMNLMKGVKEGFVKEMVVRYSHFPIKLKVSGKYLLIENFLGERKPRKAKIQGDVKVLIKGNELRIEGLNIEDVSQTAANIRQATKIKHKDIRIFQDGIYIKG